MKSLRVFLGSVLAVAVLTALFVSSDSTGGALRGVREFFVRTFDPNYSYQSFMSLRAENERLRAERALSEATPPATLPSFEYRAIRIYSRYPLNDRRRLILDAGSEEGISVGMPVLMSPGVLLGSVVRVDRTRAEVETVFDPAWKSSVLIGTSSIKAVLEGGAPPRLSLIPEDAVLSLGAPVTNIAPEFPLGALWGTLASVSVDAHNVWQNATLEVPYHTELIDSVLIPTNYP